MKPQTAEIDGVAIAGGANETINLLREVRDVGYVNLARKPNDEVPRVVTDPDEPFLSSGRVDRFSHGWIRTAEASD